MRQTALVAMLFAAWATTTPALALSSPDGRYCGLLLSGGFMVPATTQLATGKNGKVTGTYEFTQRGRTESGSLTEIAAGARKMTRILRWRDRFGSGRLVVTFTPDFTSFEGRWGPENAKPKAHWSGRLCAPKSIS